MSVLGLCFQCQKSLQFSEKKVSFREECPHCHADVHVCKNCEFYDPKAYNECRESSADRVTEKERANYCEYFQISSGTATQDRAAALKAAADALFKKS
ncbi:MAG: hypothetical protein COT73_05470 [Bdellovibrio sp. CG10_big_fil_rev_8_21_14_0_10_47_8]|nr:MAG: hypothetical protein COT73_05470 [Bdellovibrio sp. CG10_big_fil_rev_8_21_14_0_10_47_8]